MRRSFLLVNHFTFFFIFLEQLFLEKSNSSCYFGSLNNPYSLGDWIQTHQLGNFGDWIQRTQRKSSKDNHWIYVQNSKDRYK